MLAVVQYNGDDEAIVNSCGLTQRPIQLQQVWADNRSAITSKPVSGGQWVDYENLEKPNFNCLLRNMWYPIQW